MARKAAAQVKEGTPEPEPAPVITEPIEIEVSEPTIESVVQTGPEISEPEPPAPPPPPQPQPEPPAQQPSVREIALQQRLREVEMSEQVARQQLDHGYRQSQQQIFDAQYDAVVNSMGAAQAELAAAKQELKVAGNEGNWEQVAELQERIGRASAALSGLEQRKDAMDNWQKQQKQQARQPRQQQQPQQRQPTVEEIISNSGLPDRAKSWLRQHPDYITDPAKNNRIQVLHDVAMQESGGQFTDAYFDRMEALLGMKQPSSQPTNGSAQPSTQQRQSALVSAPPTRETPSMATGRAPQPTKITLSAEQQEIAWATRPDDKMTRAQANEVYARNVLKMQQLKASGKLS